MSKAPACNPLAAPPSTALSAPLTLHPYVPADGTPLSELSWSSSLAVVAVSFSGLFTFIFLMLACLCCKKGDIGFKVRAGHPVRAGGCSPHWGLPVPCHRMGCGCCSGHCRLGGGSALHITPGQATPWLRAARTPPGWEAP